MLQRFTEKLKRAIIFVILFVAIWIAVAILVFGIFRALSEFKIINGNVHILIFAITTVIAVLFFIWTCRCIKAEQKTKIENWISMHEAHFISLYIVAVILFGSLSAEVTRTIDELKDLVSLEWSMLGISVAIFLVWNVVILKYLKDRQPAEKVAGGWIDKYMYIAKKGEFYQTASMLFSTTTFLYINVVVVIIATATVYLFEGEVTLWKQNAVIVSFLFCTNTVGILFGDILKPINEEKKSMLQAMKITDAEVEFQNKLSQQIDESLLLVTMIDQLESIGEEEKIRMKLEIRHKIIGEKLNDPAE